MIKGKLTFETVVVSGRPSCPISYKSPNPSVYAIEVKVSEAVCTGDAEICLMYFVCLCLYVFGNVYFYKGGRWERNHIAEGGSDLYDY